ncbi:MAG: response regulator transcription factor [Chloroflexi bacterium]|nr:response regulator transcription factor [Chloroflexota bacterium]
MNKKIKVMIVDDHAILRDGIKALLSLQEDMEVVGEAANGKEALEKTREVSPDVVIMDIAMPVMNGLEATRRITKENEGTKVLVLTQHDNKEYIVPIIKSGAAGCIPKKAVASELVAGIRAINRGESFLYPSVAKTLIEDYLRQGEAIAQTDPYERLTDREREVLKLVAEGRTNREIAEMLVISIKTVLGHRNNLMEKLGIHNRTDLVKYAIRKGLIDIDNTPDEAA